MRKKRLIGKLNIYDFYVYFIIVVKIDNSKKKKNFTFFYKECFC